MVQVQELIEQALAESAADGCVVVAAEHTETNLRWAGNSLTTNGQMHSRSMTVISTFDGADGSRAGVVTRSISTPEELTELVRASERSGRQESVSDDAAPLIENYENDDDWSADPAATSVAVFDQFAPALGAAFAQWARSERLLFGFAEHQMTSTFLATSTGLRRRFDQPDGRLEINGKSMDLSRSAYASTRASDFATVNVDSLIAELERRLHWAGKSIELPAGRYETILPPSTIADLMVYAYWTASARDAEEGRNVYAKSDGKTRIGEVLSSLPLRLYSDPSHAALECAPFVIATESFGGLMSVFDNGAPSGEVDWIRDGTLQNLVRTRGWAARSGGQACAAGDNLILDGGGTASVDEMVTNTERGLLLTCLWYIREVDPQTLLLTGLTRDGVYLVENGQVQGAVNNFRFNESPIDLLGRVTEVSATELAMSREWSDYFRRTAMPAMRIPDFNMSTVSQAS